MPLGEAVEARVLTCLERVEKLLDDLDRLAADPSGRPQHQRLQAEMRRELESAEKAIKAAHDPQ